MRTILLLAALAAPLVIWAVLPVPSPGASSAQRLDDIAGKLRRAEGRVTARRTRERLLTTDIAAYDRRIDAFSARVVRLERREAAVGVSLRSERRALANVQSRLRAERRRLVRLRARLRETRRALAARLRARYQSGTPDLVTVVLEADGFAQLLDDADFMRRVSDQDQRIIAVVRRAQDDARRQARRLQTLERRQRAATAAIQARHDELAELRRGVQDARARVVTVRAARTSDLRRVRVSRTRLQGQVSALRAAQARIRRALQRAQQANAGAFARSGAGAPRVGGGGFVWPVNGTITSPFCERRSWEACHPGLDIGAAEGTPIRAASAGTVVLLQPTAASGGYGNYTCVQHAAALSSCYAHQSRFGTAPGARVARGQVIGYVGNTGRSFGAHLHFEIRVNGSVVSPLGYL